MCQNQSWISWIELPIMLHQLRVVSTVSFFWFVCVNCTQLTVFCFVFFLYLQSHMYRKWWWEGWRRPPPGTSYKDPEACQGWMVQLLDLLVHRHLREFHRHLRVVSVFPDWRRRRHIAHVAMGWRNVSSLSTGGVAVVGSIVFISVFVYLKSMKDVLGIVWCKSRNVVFDNYRIVIEENPDAVCLSHLILCISRLAGCAIRLLYHHLYCILIASLPPSVSQSPGLATTMSSSLFNLSRTNYLSTVLQKVYRSKTLLIDLCINNSCSIKTECYIWLALWWTKYSLAITVFTARFVYSYTPSSPSSSTL